MTNATWWVKGMLFENCSCQLLCPAHISFKQICENDRCRGHWAAHVAEGRFGEVVLDGLNVVVVFEAPVRMYEGDWTQTFYIDDRADGAQRDALETIFAGRAGGPWEMLGQFVSTQLESRFVPMRFQDGAREKRLSAPGLFDTTVTAIRGSDGKTNALLSNLYNVIHGAVHVLARGKTRCTDRVFDFTTDGTHGLYSDFSWQVDAARRPRTATS